MMEGRSDISFVAKKEMETLKKPCSHGRGRAPDAFNVPSQGSWMNGSSSVTERRKYFVQEVLRYVQPMIRGGLHPSMIGSLDYFILLMTTVAALS